MHISITEDNIEEGAPGEERRCAVALNLRSLVLPDTFLEVHADKVVIYESYESRKRIFECALPEVAKEFIREFDRVDCRGSNLPEPVEFDLHLPENYLR